MEVGGLFEERTKLLDRTT